MLVLLYLMSKCSCSQDCGWKGWGEISYGGYESVKRAKAAEFLVKSPCIYHSHSSLYETLKYYATANMLDDSSLFILRHVEKAKQSFFRFLFLLKVNKTVWYVNCNLDNNIIPSY